jgi:hypothetical protein
MNELPNETPAGPSCDLKNPQSACDLPENRWRPPPLDRRFAALAIGMSLVWIALAFAVSRLSLVAVTLWMLTYLFG